MKQAMNSRMWQLLEEAGTINGLNRMDERGSHEDVLLLDAMVEMEYLDKHIDPANPEQFGYSITQNGEDALAKYREEHHTPEPPANVAPSEWSLLAEVADGKYNEIPGGSKLSETLSEALNDLVARGYAEVDVDGDPPGYRITQAGAEALEKAQSRVPRTALK